MSDDLTFLHSFHTRHVTRIGQRLSGCIRRYFIAMDLMLNLFKYVVWSHIEYGTQFWCLYLEEDILDLVLLHDVPEK